MLKNAKTGNRNDSKTEGFQCKNRPKKWPKPTISRKSQRPAPGSSKSQTLQGPITQ